MSCEIIIKYYPDYSSIKMIVYSGWMMVDFWADTDGGFAQAGAELCQKLGRLSRLQVEDSPEHEYTIDCNFPADVLATAALNVTQFVNSIDASGRIPHEAVYEI